METVNLIFNFINTLTWGWSLIPMLVIFGVLFTIVGGFAQFGYFKRMFRILFEKKDASDPNAISGRQALFVSIGGRVGGGNIAGVAVAISLGGPGAVFWMWVVALIGMMTSIIECSLAQLYKRRDPDGSYRGGPASYIVHGLGKDYKWMAALYSIALMLTFAISFSAFQGNTVAGAASDSFEIDRIYTGLFLAALTGIIIFGGIKRIAKVSDFLIPVMAIIYIAMAFIVILMNITELPGLIAMIVKNAFGIESAVGGGIGVALMQGMKRGLFSNEAGLGSAPNVAAAAHTKHPISQGISQSLSVFIDTIILCSATAFVILLGDAYQAGNTMDGVVLTQQSLVSHFGEWSQYLLTISILFFSFSSILYNYYLGENSVHFLSDKNSKTYVFILKIAVIGMVLLGAVQPGATAVFAFSDPLMGLLALINLLALVMLFPRAAKLLKDYRAQIKAGVDDPVFDAQEYERLDIDLAAWGKEPTKK